MSGSRTNKPKLLIVEDDEGLTSQYRWAFPGYDVLITHARPQAVAAVKRDAPPLAIMDLGLPPDPDGVSEGFATLEEILRLAPRTKVIVVTGNGDRKHALRAIALGAYDFCEKPIELDTLRTIVERGIHLFRLEEENRRLSAMPASSPVTNIITAHPAMLKVCRDIEKVASANVPVLLLGESGTGKEALARAVHDLGPRAKHPFVAINCGAIPENLLESELFGHERGAFTGAVKQTIGKIESANKGTLFLDEIGDLPYPLQVKLLRFLQDQIVERIGGRQKIQVDVRIVSATNADLDEKIEQGLFRGDLLYRMNALTVRIPPLRERGSDISLLASYFLNRFNREFNRGIRGFTERAVVAMNAHDWPGNVRELENRVKRAVVMAENRMIDAADLELEAEEPELPDLDLRTARLRAEREVIQNALARSNNTMAVAARLLGVSRPTLYGLMEAHGLLTDASGVPETGTVSDDSTL
ncbi:PEP-CTERM-box response regulator transcription factor [Rhodopila sp.]|jgi:two-component system NtrC family response regulator|uniref:PEP-CTERM-box response regulator transcription factor n=1 Tax=Rhodopila sp. TaxID=2480087 RepID=UPI002C6EF7DC|nr:PEP-CTERM-box response regulator transcription factor [Rhodopila sp.]HVZ08606.1 PEP-CTERM-box response regulator transcription factor [Rhodopila sp.]